MFEVYTTMMLELSWERGILTSVIIVSRGFWVNFWGYLMYHDIRATFGIWTITLVAIVSGCSGVNL